MSTYVVRRFLYVIPTLLGISFISFFVMQLPPGDAFSTLALNPNISPETLELMRARFGLDLPLRQQYLKWLQNAIHLDFGHSFTYNAPVSFLIGSRALNTILLSAASMALAWGLAIPIGIHAARHQYAWSDRLLTFFAFIGISIPNFFLALVVLFFIVKFDIPLPIGGATSIGYEGLGFFGRVWDRAQHLAVPTFVLGTAAMAGLMRYMRSSLLDTLRQDYVRTARSKGMRERVIVYKHAVRNAINPMITIFGFQIGEILSGAALTEIITGYPGLGKLALQAITGLDWYLVMGILVIGSVLLIVGNLVADILLAVTDPRIRYN